MLQRPYSVSKRPGLFFLRPQSWGNKGDTIAIPRVAAKSARRNQGRCGTDEVTPSFEPRNRMDLPGQGRLQSLISD
jgi:hypothetical protein